MNIQLKQVTRENWEEALKIKANQTKSDFAPSVAVSLAKVYIKPDGDNVEYIPFAIYEQEKMIGFIMHAFEIETTDMYWINGFIIDESFQGKGYGRAALLAMLEWIKNRFAHCKEIRLTVHKDNETARELYKSEGFLPTGDVWGNEEVYYLAVRK